MDNIQSVIQRKQKYAVFPMICADHCAWLLKKPFSEVAQDGEMLASVLEYGLNFYGYDAVMLFSDAYVEAEAMGCPVSFTPYPKLDGPQSHTNRDRTGNIITAARILKNRTDAPVFVSIKGPFSLAAFLVGVTEFLKIVLTNPKRALSVIAQALDFQIQYTKKLLSIGVHVFIGDPMASTSVVSPGIFSDFAYKPLQVLCQEIKDCGFLAGIHICGDTKPIVSAIDSIGFDILSIEDITPDTKTTKMGGVSTTTLFSGDHDLIRKEISAALDLPYLILSTSCDVPVETDPQSIKTMVSYSHDFNND